MDDNTRAASGRWVRLDNLEIEVMALMVLLNSSGEPATFQYLGRWKQRLAHEQQALTPVTTAERGSGNVS